MPSINKPTHQAIFQDLCATPPKKGYLIKALKALDQQQPLTALSRLLTVLEIKHKLIGERNTILKFTCDPLSWAVQISAPIPTRKDVIYANCLGDGEEARTFEVQCRRSLITVAEFLLKKNDELKIDRNAALKPKPRTDKELLDILRSTSPSTGHACFAEAERALERDCLLDACVQLLTPFGIQPRLEGRKVVFKKKCLKNLSDAVISIERLDWYFDIEAFEEEKVSRKDSSHDDQDDEVGQDSRVNSPIPPSPWNRHTLRTSIVVQGLSSKSPANRDTDAQRYFPAVLKASHFEHKFEKDDYGSDFNFENAVVFNIACVSERLALAERVVLMRNEMRIEDEEAQKRFLWSGKMAGWDRANWVQESRIVGRRRKCWARVNALRDELTVEELVEWDEERERMRRGKG
ncbi:hypothetical protein BKA66DRAFT_465890 [Pyrenochaeta sp. MPI-SDFR-AT-0127]|nr:hypothetical protein BKA66DRAFT_465890 [Pyrenochaeta sp. MPI-SDFR-AT-0127]